MVLVISLLYVAYGGLWWMQALFYGIGAAVIAIIAIAAYKLSRSTNKSDPALWFIFAALTVVTAWAQAELAEFFIIAGLFPLFWRAWPGWRRARTIALIGAGVILSIGLLEIWARHAGTTTGSGNTLVQTLLFFTKAGAFVFGSGLAIVPFLQQGVVQQFGWLNEHQFLDAVAVAMITPGPVVITVGFIGFLVAGLAGAIAAAIGIFLPVYLFTILPAPWFKRHRNNPQLKAFVDDWLAGLVCLADTVVTGLGRFDDRTNLVFSGPTHFSFQQRSKLAAKPLQFLDRLVDLVYMLLRQPFRLIAAPPVGAVQLQ